MNRWSCVSVQCVFFGALAITTLRMKYLWTPYMCVLGAAAIADSQVWAGALSLVKCRTAGLVSCQWCLLSLPFNATPPGCIHQQGSCGLWKFGKYGELFSRAGKFEENQNAICIHKCNPQFKKEIWTRKGTFCIFRGMQMGSSCSDMSVESEPFWWGEKKQKNFWFADTISM